MHLSIPAWQSVQKGGSVQMRYVLSGHAGLKSLISVHDTQTARWMLNDVWYQAELQRPCLVRLQQSK